MITGLDFLLVVFMLISAVLAMVRGFTREVLAILSWIAAAIGTILLYPRFRDLAREQLQPDWLADAALIGGVFFLILILVSFVTIRISDIILDSRIGALDRSLGFVFGLGRGFLLAVIAIMFLNWFIPVNRQPGWIAEARSKPVLDNAGETLVGMLPEDPEADLFNTLKDRIQQDSRAPAENPAPQAEVADRGYGTGERQGLNQLLESTDATRQ